MQKIVAIYVFSTTGWANELQSFQWCVVRGE